MSSTPREEKKFSAKGLLIGSTEYTFNGRYICQYIHRTSLFEERITVYEHEDGNYVLRFSNNVKKYSPKQLKNKYPSLAARLGYIDEVQI